MRFSYCLPHFLKRWFYLPARADLSKVVNGSLHGYEIKSDADTLTRLPTQAKCYNTLFDQMTLVAAPRHIERAITMVPIWWALAVADYERKGVVIRILRNPGINPNPSLEVSLRMLHRQEVEKLVVDMELSDSPRKYYAWELNALLVQNAHPKALRNAIRLGLQAAEV